MPLKPVGFSSSSGGGGLHYRRPVDVFADATARSTYFTTTEATAYQDFVSDEFLAIVIGTIAAPTDFQTYVGDVTAYDDTMWVSRTDAVRGFPGANSTVPGPAGVGTPGTDGTMALTERTEPMAPMAPMALPEL